MEGMNTLSYSQTPDALTVKTIISIGKGKTILFARLFE
jgi:hypothetical protein